ncbi:putative disease resistance RPP13-like protein 1 [Populus alba]|uniref:putative disease resistance RPP13-like protein 1 n=1 Tax=Populus alba TaxID=43335 RepID=UPI003CC73BF3
MALALIGGSILSPVIQVLVDRLASRQVLGFFKSHKLDDGLLEKLKETLNTVNGLLDDAEEKQITNRAVKNWLNDVKHAVYEAEDILDEINYEDLRSKDIDRPDSNRVRDRVPFLNPANRRMKEMEQSTAGWRPLSEKTTPLVNESLVYGRDADKEAIMEHLLTQHNTDGSNLCAIPIVGMGGIGKTALAQLIYNDEKGRSVLPTQGLGLASQQFDVARIIKDLLEKINASTCRTKEPDESLMEAVEGKKLLLVLDDAWNIEYNEWDKLLLPLRYVEHGSKIVVTTREEDVARVTQTVIPSHRLNVISDEDCWELFARHAFSSANSGAFSHLETFGRAIARKCKGLPLAAKTLGVFCISEGDVKEWEKISNSNMWVQPRGVEEMEDIGEKYFDDLVSRSLFQRSTRDSIFRMHDLISDLADYVSGEFCFKLGINESGCGLQGEHSCSLPERTRYLSITSGVPYGGGLRIFRSIHGVQHLRALFPLNFFGEADSEALNDILPNLKRLQMLSCNMKHLRLLDLSYTTIGTLPAKVCTLYYLQTLLLRECRYLMELPSNISNLVDLQHLDIEGTNLKEMPPKMGKLTKLRTLQYYIVGKESGSSMKELGKLSHIRKKLSIRNLRDVANAQDALDANLKGKKKIEELGLTWDGNTDDTRHEREVLERLEPSENVKELAIIGYGGTTFPGWLGNSSFSNMVGLTLSGCKNCISLPPLGQLSSLEELQIKGFDEVVAVGSELYGSDSSMEKPFKSLKILKFKGMKKWQEWNTDVAGAFPHLAELCLAGCPELTNALPSHLPCLSMLSIEECPQLVVSIPEAPMLNVIKVCGVRRMKTSLQL